MSYAQAASKGPKQSPEEDVEGTLDAFRVAMKTAELALQNMYPDSPASAAFQFCGLAQILGTTDPFANLSRAPQPAQVENTEGPASDLIDVDSPHISQVHSDFKSQAQQTGTQAERMAQEAEDQARQTSQEAQKKASETGKQAEQKASETSGEAKKKASELSGEAEEKTDELSKDASKNYEKAKKTASEDYDKSKKYASAKYREGKEFASETKDELNIKARETKNDLSANRDNPVIVGNAIAWTIGGVALGVGAYNKHVKGELDWGVVGMAAGAVGVLAVGDYFLSQWLFKNKYPKK